MQENQEKGSQMPKLNRFRTNILNDFQKMKNISVESQLIIKWILQGRSPIFISFFDEKQMQSTGIQVYKKESANCQLLRGREQTPADLT